MVKAVIGPRGATIKQVREQSGCAIKVSDEVVPGTDEQTVTFTGTEQQVTAAMGMVQSVVDAQPPGGAPPALSDARALRCRCTARSATAT